MPTRAEFQKMADDRILDAQTLLDGQRWSAAYYLAGYAVECGLKACILANVERNPHVIFEDRNFSASCFKHDASQLLDVTGLRGDLAREIDANRTLGDNWLKVKDWSERSRYEDRPRSEAEELVMAVSDPRDGVLPWIKRHW